jgi:hypothetical protein
VGPQRNHAAAILSNQTQGRTVRLMLRRTKAMAEPKQQPLPVGPAPSVEEWIEKLNRACGGSAGWAIQTGCLLLQAKKQLPHGEWLVMWGSRRIKFGLRTGEMLMCVARQPAFRNSQNFSNLPAAWSILYELSQLPPVVVEEGIACGVIHPELKLTEARRMVRQLRSGRWPTYPKPRRRLSMWSGKSRACSVPCASNPRAGPPGIGSSWRNYWSTSPPDCARGRWNYESQANCPGTAGGRCSHSGVDGGLGAPVDARTDLGGVVFHE